MNHTLPKTNRFREALLYVLLKLAKETKSRHKKEKKTKKKQYRASPPICDFIYFEFCSLLTKVLYILGISVYCYASRESTGKVLCFNKVNGLVQQTLVQLKRTNQQDKREKENTNNSSRNNKFRSASSSHLTLTIYIIYICKQAWSLETVAGCVHNAVDTVRHSTR